MRRGGAFLGTDKSGKSAGMVMYCIQVLTTQKTHHERSGKSITRADRVHNLDREPFMPGNLSAG